MKRQTVALDDMAKLFADRLRTLMIDCFDTSIHAGVSEIEGIQLILSGLLTEVVFGSRTLHMTSEEYLDLCKRAYWIIVEEVESRKL
jgi:hypothetical protein